MVFLPSVYICLGILFIGTYALRDENILLKFSRMEEAVSKLVDENVLLKNELDKMKADYKIHKYELRTLRAEFEEENTALKNELSNTKALFTQNLETCCERITKDINMLMNDIKILKTNADGQVVRIRTELKKEIGHFKNEMSMVKAIVGVQKDKTNEELPEFSKVTPVNTKDGAKRIRRIVPPSTAAATAPQSLINKVGFFAVMSAHNVNLGLQQTIKFQKIITNTGNGLDSNTSVFKAPVSGLYFFSANLMTYGNEDFEAELIKNGATIVEGYFGNGNTYSTGSLNGVLQMEAGDDVWIQINKSGYNDGNVRVHGSGFSWFSGFLITE